MAVTSARGMRDFSPREKERRDAILAVIAETYQRHGFDAIETPALEDSRVLHSGLGGDNEKLSFQVLKRGLEASDLASAKDTSELSDLGLRFDLTVPLARFYATHHATLPPVFRAFHTGPVWRAERPQKGRYRQFVQCDIDILGEPGVLAEVEVMIATADALTRLGLEGFTFRVNDRRLLTELLGAAGVAPDSQSLALITLDKLDKVGVEGVLAELRERLPAGFDESMIQAVLESTETADDATAIAALMGNTPESLAAATELVSWVSQVAGVIGEDALVFDPTLVRGMGYYTGSIVEIAHPDLGISLGGGGRYDGMIGRFLGSDVPAFGVSLGFERLVDILESAPVVHHDRVALVIPSAEDTSHVIALKKHLVDTGHTVRLVAEQKNMRVVYEQLVADGFSRVASVSPAIHQVGDLTWKDLT
jgi:histidyl-tRNA synthetase